MTDEKFECPPNDITGSSLDIGSMVSPHWRRGLRLQPVSAPNLVGQAGAGGPADSDNGIHPRHPSSHWLWASEILSIKSPVMSCNTVRAVWLLENNSPLLWLICFQ